MVIIIIALAALVGGSFFMKNAKDDVIIYNNTIDDVGTFNTTNVTNFTLDEDTYNDGQTHYSANDSIAQVAIGYSSALIDNTKEDSDKVNDSLKGHTIYKTTANVGEHKGEIRYFSILKDSDKDRYIFISSEDYNLTCMMVDSFKIY